MGRGRGSQLETALGVLRRLHARPAGATLAELAEETGLSERTVRRYVDDVGAIYFPVTSERGSDGRRRWRFAPDSHFALALSADEALLLARLRPVLTAACETLPLGALAAQVLGRIEAAVPSHHHAAMERLVERFGVAATAGAGRAAPEVWCLFDHAAREGRALAVRYDSLRRSTARRFDPYLLFISDGTPYAYGLDHQHDEERVLALDRVRSARSLGRRFERPLSLTAQTSGFVSSLYRGYAGAPRHAIVLRARGRAARLLERPETPDATVERLGRGEVRVRFSAPDVPPLRGRILSLGAEVIVESPEFLADAVAQSAKAIAARYPAAPPAKVERIKPERAAARRAQRRGGRGKGKSRAHRIEKK